MAKITVQSTPVTVLSIEERDYISLTDMASAKEGDNRAADIIKNWIRNRYAIEFLGTWEVIHNPDFKVVEFDHFRKSAGLPSFVLSASEWIECTHAIGIVVKKGRYGGTYAHKDIAFEFGSAISVPFKLYLIEEFQRLKEQEQAQLGWNAKRELSKINYRIHTDAIKQNLIPAEVTPAQANVIYASEADVLNVAMFGVTAGQWREANPGFEREHPRLCHDQRVDMPLEYGKPQCRIHRAGHTAGRASRQAQPGSPSGRWRYWKAAATAGGN